MPNHAVQCPQCGSGSCQEYRADAFVCQHCDSTFRWVHPAQLTVSHRRSHCVCGKNSLGYCTQCQEPVCRQHFANWKALFGAWQELKLVFAQGRPEWLKAVRTQGGMSSPCFRRDAGWLSASGSASHINAVARGASFPWPLFPEVKNPVLKRLGLSTPADEDLLCISCLESQFSRLLAPIESRIAQLEAAGELCQICSEERKTDMHLRLAMAFPATGICHGCRISICAGHRHTCSGCRTAWCVEHLPDRNSTRCRHCGPLARLARLFK